MIKSFLYTSIYIFSVRKKHVSDSCCFVNPDCVRPAGSADGLCIGLRLLSGTRPCGGRQWLQCPPPTLPI